MSKITEIIEKMQEIYEKYGDIGVVYWDSDWGEYYNIDSNCDENMTVIFEDGEAFLSMNGSEFPSKRDEI